MPGWVSRAVTRPPELCVLLFQNRPHPRRLLQTTEHNQKGLRDTVLLYEQMLELTSPVNPESQVCVSPQTRAAAGNTVYGTPRGQVVRCKGTQLRLWFTGFACCSMLVWDPLTGN